MGCQTLILKREAFSVSIVISIIKTDSLTVQSLPRTKALILLKIPLRRDTFNLTLAITVLLIRLAV